MRKCGVISGLIRLTAGRAPVDKCRSTETLAGRGFARSDGAVAQALLMWRDVQAGIRNPGAREGAADAPFARGPLGTRVPLDPTTQEQAMDPLFAIAGISFGLAFALGRHRS